MGLCWKVPIHALASVGAIGCRCQLVTVSSPRHCALACLRGHHWRSQVLGVETGRQLWSQNVTVSWRRSVSCRVGSVAEGAVAATSRCRGRGSRSILRRSPGTTPRSLRYQSVTSWSTATSIRFSKKLIDILGHAGQEPVPDLLRCPHLVSWWPNRIFDPKKATSVAGVTEQVVPARTVRSP